MIWNIIKLLKFILLPTHFRAEAIDNAAILEYNAQLLRRPSSRGLGHCPFTAATGVRIPVGVPIQKPACFKQVFSYLTAILFQTVILPEKYFPTVRILINKQLAGISRYLKGCDKISIIKHGRGVCLKTENIPVEPDWQETGVAASGTVH